MRNLSICVAMSWVVACSGPPPRVQFIEDDYAGARAKAIKLGVPLFVEVYAPW